MEVRNCKGCGRLFNYLGGRPICPSCAKKLEEKFLDVKKYIYEHRNATIDEIATQNEVSVGQIHQWIREERLSFTDDSPVKLSCENCGALINTGRFCGKCKSNLSSSMMNAVKREEPKPMKKEQANTSAKMRFLDQDE